MALPNSRWTRIALYLVGVTAAYNAIEAVIAIWSGLVAGSVALIGFGLDSVIELAAAAVLLWRLRLESRGAHTGQVERSERRAQRFIGATFIALALYVVIQSAVVLWSASQPEESLVGLVLAGVSLVLMPLVAWGKIHAARQLGSAALRAEAKETLACSYLSLTLLVGLLANALFGWWWADPAAALLMVPWLIREGREGLEGGD